MRKIIIALDGYSGTGKSSTARMASQALSYSYIDSGAMYRAVTFYFLKEKIDIIDDEQVKDALALCEVRFNKNEIFLNGANIENEIRSMEVNQFVSDVSTISLVRKKLVEQQREISKNKGVVMDGRDIGTVVFPKAELKLFMIAEIDARVKRRKKQLAEKGIIESEEVIKQNLLRRDQIDTTREDSPLRQAKDAVVVDTSHLTLDDQVKKIVNLANRMIHENRD
ncbi:MAG: (d)CMP kinase [Bacteroidota bacterium]